MKHGSRAARSLAITSQMIGRKFGKLTVASHDPKLKRYVCRCDCGGTTLSRKFELEKGRHKACLCGRTADRLSTRLPDHAAATNWIYHNYRKAAGRRGYQFKLTKEEFNRLIRMNCHYCGCGPSMSTSWVRGHSDFSYNGVDRKDNAIGYISSNCVPCCDICNNSKSTLTYDRWVEWLTRVSRNLHL